MIIKTMRMFSRGFLLAVSLVLWSLGALASAQTKADNEQYTNYTVSVPDLVLELFTSQACSSCPAANEFIMEMAKDPKIMALSYSVDYWNYLGWEDTYSKPEFSARQHEYDRRLGGGVYTPQIIVNGKIHSSGFTKAELAKYKSQIPMQMRLQANGGEIKISLGEPIKNEDLRHVMAVYYKKGMARVPVAAGENKGRIIDLANVVKICQPIRWDLSGRSFSIKMPPNGQSVAILLQEGKGGPILAAIDYYPKIKGQK